MSVSFVDEHRLYNWTMPNPLIVVGDDGMGNFLEKWTRER